MASHIIINSPALDWVKVESEVTSTLSYFRVFSKPNMA